MTTANPPGQPTLHRRASTHPIALERMRAELESPARPLAVRGLARQGTGDPAIALLDAWAVVADVVAFYSERIATEGFLRTATQRRSVRELARTLGYELRPGVASQVDLAFTAESAKGAPETIAVLQGTPVQSVPGQGELPQTFETVESVELRSAWNVLPAKDSQDQRLTFGRRHIWLRGSSALRVGDSVLIVGSERAGLADLASDPANVNRWAFRAVVEITPDAEGFTGWTRLLLDRPIAERHHPERLPRKDVTVQAFVERVRLFGWNAPDPNLLVIDGKPPTGAEGSKPPYSWTGFAVAGEGERVIEIDGVHPALLAGSWVVLQQPGEIHPYLVEAAEPDGASKFAISGPLTRTTLDVADDLDTFTRPSAVVHCVSVPLDAAQEPAQRLVGGRTISVQVCDPPLPVGRRIVISGTDAVSGLPAVETATVLTSTITSDGATMVLTLEADLGHDYVPRGLRVLGNVVRATHGETVNQVLGSGDGRSTFAAFTPRRPPLTYVRATTPAGARAELTVRVDGVVWHEVANLTEAGPNDRVYVVRHDEDGSVRIVLGDGINGARPASGAENITAIYRVGIGAAGGVGAGQVSLLARRPLGVRGVTNPAAAQDWAAAETLEEARTNAPLRVRTLDRAVSVSDHEDIARGYAGVGPARADLVWDGRVNRVVLSVLGTAAELPSADLIDDLRSTLIAARDPGSPLDVRIGTRIWFGVRVEVAHDPAYERDRVVIAVADVLAAVFGAAGRPFATPVTASVVLVVIRRVSGVAACTMPRLLPIGAVPLPPTLPTIPPDSQALDVLPALPARWDETILPAQLLAFAPGAVEVGEMTL